MPSQPLLSGPLVLLLPQLSLGQLGRAVVLAPSCPPEDKWVIPYGLVCPLQVYPPIPRLQRKSSWRCSGEFVMEEGRDVDTAVAPGVLGGLWAHTGLDERARLSPRLCSVSVSVSVLLFSTLLCADMAAGAVRVLASPWRRVGVTLASRLINPKDSNTCKSGSLDDMQQTFRMNVRMSTLSGTSMTPPLSAAKIHT